MRVEGRHIHFVGVGGIGMSAIAHMAVEKGAIVSGCDAREGSSTRALAERGCRIWRGHDPTHLDGVELVVRSSAISESAPEIRAALERHIPVVGRARMLARFTDDHRVVGVAGAHGKTTTTWLVAKLLIEARRDPSVMVGGMVDELGGNYRLGAGDLFVAELDESDGSLLEFRPQYPIVTNIDHEHVDYYPTLDAVKDTFRRYMRRTRPEGCLIICTDDGPARDTRDAWPQRCVTYGESAEADLRAVGVRSNGGSSTFDVRHPGGTIADLTVSLPGRHNVVNALAAVAMALELGIAESALRTALGQLTGVARRLQEKGAAGDVRFLDDYAHHPAEVQATLEAARHLVSGRLIGVFQPHRYTRTLHLGSRFGACFDHLDHLVLLPIYPAGETPIHGVSTAIIADAVRQDGTVEMAHIEDWAAARDHLLVLLEPGDTLLTLGAGNVYQLGEQVLAEFANSAKAAASPREGGKERVLA